MNLSRLSAIPATLRHILHSLRALAERWLPLARRGGAGDYRPRARYRLSLDRTSTLTRLASVTGSKTRMILLAALVFILCGGVWLSLFIYTPARYLLPARFTPELSDRYADMSVRLDSVAEATRLYEAYADNIRAILSDSLPPSQASQARSIPDIQDIPLDQLMTSSDAERQFVAAYDDAERYNLSVLSPIAAEGMTFYAPVAGVDAQPVAADIPGMAIAAAKATPVSAVYRGTVVSCHFIPGRGTTVVIQHPNDFVSLYSGLAQSFVARGAKVRAGERLGIANGQLYPLTFELWHNGSALPPEDYISF